MTARAGRLFLALALAAAAWAVVVALSGGVSIELADLRLSSRDPLRPLTAALVCAVLAWLLMPRLAFTRDLRMIAGTGERAATRVAIIIALSAFVVAVAWNTRAAGGSDSSCYILQADAFARGEIALRDPLAQALPREHTAMFAPTGFVASPVEAGAAVPICGPGLALMMAPFPLVGASRGLLLVVPIAASLTVWLTFVFARRITDVLVAVIAALLVAASPIFLYQAVQPMSDVPAAMLWMASLVAVARGDARGEAAGGALFSLAVLTRPNLAPLGIPLAALLAGRTLFSSSLARFVLAGLPGAAVFAWLNAARYGSPFVSGYGETAGLFALSHVMPNLARYPRWLVDTHSPLVVLAIAAPWAIDRGATPAVRDLVRASCTAIAIVAITYLAYTVFDDWWYIRFLLPVLPLILALTVAVGDRMLRRVSRHARWMTPAIGIVLAVWYLHVARERHVFELQAFESRFVATGEYAARALPAGAVVLAVQETGSIRYYGRRSTITWDAVDRRGLDAVVATVRGIGRPVFLALEDWEEPRFRTYFEGERFGALDWTPMAQIDGVPRVRIYDVAWREREGERLSTEHVGFARKP